MHLSYSHTVEITSHDLARHFIFRFKDTDSTVAKRGSVFVGLMTPNGAIWSRYQRAVLMR